MRFLSGPLCVLLLLPLSFLAGCQGKHNAVVKGKVQLDGEPVAEGTVQFIPLDGQANTSGAVIKDGHYRAEVPVGLMKVAITAPKVVGKKKLYNTSDSPEMPIMQERLPAKYNTQTTLQFDVKAGEQEKDWELSTK